MKIVKLLTLITLVIAVICGGCIAKSDNSATREWNFKMEKVWEIQQAGEDKLLKPGELRVADDGTLYYRDFEQDFSYIIDRDGKFVGKFAPRGKNDGELSYYFNCFTTEDGVAICAMDKLHFFTNEGKFIKAIPNNLFVRFPLAFRNINEFWVAPGALGDSPEGSAAITYVNLASGRETIVRKFALTDEEKKPTGGGVIVGLTPQIKMGYDPRSNRIYFGKNSDSVIYRLDGDGSKADSFSFTMTRPPVSKTDKENHFAKFNVPKERVAALIGTLPDQMTYYNRIQVIDGLLYLFSAEGLGNPLSGLMVHIFSPDGSELYTGRVKVEDGWYICNSPENLQLIKGFVYVCQENDRGDKKLVKYKIDLPQS